MGPETGRIAAGHQCDPGRRALRHDVMLVELHAGLCQLVDVRRADLVAVIPDIGPAHVIDHDQDNVGLRRSFGHYHRCSKQPESQQALFHRAFSRIFASVVFIR